eukprot:CAMPEP_0177701828 /NCGR_PEP_ID=MMETSP0484_2-20121128/6815_1 /TAXON_ID=354590 /ORGANISM="Rhodomonas lens, Strain RHODO" /LENGTH=66 /DNA_ID=CAMNT_0019213079 /DNA_START=417 /DNA_END=614 /DNA_ORIENTATION=+
MIRHARAGNGQQLRLVRKSAVQFCRRMPAHQETARDETDSQLPRWSRLESLDQQTATSRREIDSQL